MLENIKAIFFDADDTIIDHKDCERQALVYLFKNIGEKYKDEYQEIFRPLDRELWDSVALNVCNIPKELIPEYRFKILFNKINIKYDNYKKADELFKEGLEQSVALIKNAEEVVEYLYNKNYKLFVVTNGLIRFFGYYSIRGSRKPKAKFQNIQCFVKEK